MNSESKNIVQYIGNLSVTRLEKTQSICEFHPNRAFFLELLNIYVNKTKTKLNHDLFCYVLLPILRRPSGDQGGSKAYDDIIY